MVKWRPNRLVRYTSKIVQAAKKVDPTAKKVDKIKNSEKLTNGSINLEGTKPTLDQITSGKIAERNKQILDNATSTRFASTGKMHFTNGSLSLEGTTPKVTMARSSGPVITPKTVTIPDVKTLSNTDMDLLRYKLDLYGNAKNEDMVEMFKAMDKAPGMFIPNKPVAKEELPYRTGWRLVGNSLEPISFNGRPISFTRDLYKYGPNSNFRRVDDLFDSARDFYHVSDGIKIRDVKVPSIKSNGVVINRGANGFSYSPTTMDMLGQYLGGVKKIMTGEPLYEREPSLDISVEKNGGVVYAKSGIHIKKKNRGKFTSWCGGKVTSECIARGKASSNPTIRKRATFAANARKWKH